MSLQRKCDDRFGAYLREKYDNVPAVAQRCASLSGCLVCTQPRPTPVLAVSVCTQDTVQPTAVGACTADEAASQQHGQRSFTLPSTPWNNLSSSRVLNSSLAGFQRI